jgi:hypothetical protein
LDHANTFTMYGRHQAAHNRVIYPHVVTASLAERQTPQRPGFGDSICSLKVRFNLRRDMYVVFFLIQGPYRCIRLAKSLAADKMNLCGKSGSVRRRNSPHPRLATWSRVSGNTPFGHPYFPTNQIDIFDAMAVRLNCTTKFILRSTRKF